MRRGDKIDSSVWANVLTSVFRIEQTFPACGKRLLFLRGLGLSWGGGIGGGGRSMSGGFPVMWPVACKQDIVSPSPNVLSREYFPVEASISIHLRWGQLSLCSSVRAFPWQRPVLLGPSGQPCLHRYLMSDRQQWWVDLYLWQQVKDARLAVSSDLHWGVSAPRPSSQTRLLHGERCLSLSKHKNRGHKYAAMQLSLYISFLPQKCARKKQKWCIEIVKSSSSSVSGASDACPPPGALYNWLLHGWEIRAFPSSQNHANCNLQIQGLGDPGKAAHAWFRQREQTKAPGI